MAGPSGLSLAVLREALRQAIAERNLRAVADDVGMSYSGLRTFLTSKRPQRATIERVVRWYYARSRKSAAPPRADLDVAIAVLRQYVAETRARAVRDRRRQEVIDSLESDTD